MKAHVDYFVKEDFAEENQDKVKALFKTATALGMATSAASTFRATAKFNVIMNFDNKNNY